MLMLRPDPPAYQTNRDPSLDEVRRTKPAIVKVVPMAGSVRPESPGSVSPTNRGDPPCGIAAASPLVSRQSTVCGSASS